MHIAWELSAILDVTQTPLPGSQRGCCTKNLVILRLLWSPVVCMEDTDWPLVVKPEKVWNGEHSFTLKVKNLLFQMMVRSLVSEPIREQPASVWRKATSQQPVSDQSNHREVFTSWSEDARFFSSVWSPGSHDWSLGLCDPTVSHGQNGRVWGDYRTSIRGCWPSGFTSLTDASAATELAALLSLLQYLVFQVVVFTSRGFWTFLPEVQVPKHPL